MQRLALLPAAGAPAPKGTLSRCHLPLGSSPCALAGAALAPSPALPVHPPVVLKHSATEVADDFDAGDSGSQGLDLGVSGVIVYDVGLCGGGGGRGWVKSSSEEEAL